MSLPEYLATLDAKALTALLQWRSDVLVEPAPRSFRELAQRLDAGESLALALDRVNGDEVVLMREVALGSSTVGALSTACGSPAERVRAVVDGLCRQGL